MIEGLAAPPRASAVVAAPSPPARMAWLDALRGIAALIVVWYHLAPSMIGHYQASIHRYIDLGKVGVLLFFLVSGYVIPMSLERHGSLRKFWVGRLFRIYPAFIGTIVVTLVLIRGGLIAVPPSLREQTVAGVLGHVTMLQEFVGVRGLLWPFWTLSFEMTFYLIAAGLFVWRLHRLSALWAAGLALIAMIVGTSLPNAVFGGDASDRRLTAAVLVVALGLSVAAYLSGRKPLVAAAGLAGLCFVLLPLLNGHTTSWTTSTSSWQAVLMLSIMFAGTVIYRLQHAQINRVAGIAALAVVLIASVFTTWIHTGHRFDLIQWTLITVAVGGLFAVAFALRHRRMPALLSGLGAISYSVYLLHFAGLLVAVRLFGHPHATVTQRVIEGVGFAILTFGSATLFYRFIEQPGQKIGRSVQRHLDKLLGPDHWRRLEGADGATQSALSRTARGENERRSV